MGCCETGHMSIFILNILYIYTKWITANISNIGIFEERDPFHWPIMHWKKCHKFGQGPPRGVPFTSPIERHVICCIIFQYCFHPNIKCPNNQHFDKIYFLSSKMLAFAMKVSYSNTSENVVFPWDPLSQARQTFCSHPNCQNCQNCQNAS